MFDQRGGELLKELKMADPARSSLAPYGKELDRLMRDRGFRSTAELSRFLEARGIKKGVKQQTLSYHMLGRTQPRPALVDRILEELGASREDRVLVREAFWRTEWGTEPRLVGGAASEEHQDVVLDHEDEKRARRDGDQEPNSDAEGDDGPGGGST